MSRISAKLLIFARKCYRLALGDVVRVAAVVLIAAIPLLHEFEVLKGRVWLWIWLAVFLAKVVLWDQYLNGLFADKSRDQFARIHGAVAGSIDSISQKIVASDDHRLSEAESFALCMGLLHRIQDYVAAELSLPSDVRLRVTLAVPLFTQKGVYVRAVKVWCYDQPYDDRRWTELPIYRDDKTLVSGSPAAFFSGKMQIINDLHAEPQAPDAPVRNFRAVLSIPVKAGGPEGRSLAVVNIDATTTNVFQPEVVTQRVLPLIAPTVNLVGLVLLNRRDGDSYDFEN